MPTCIGRSNVDKTLIEDNNKFLMKHLSRPGPTSCAPASTSQPRDDLSPSFMPHIPKEDLRQAMIRLGETPPDKWNRDQLLLRLHKMQPDHVLFQKKNNRSQQSELRALISRAAKTKADFQNFLREKMNITLTYNETMQQLKLKGEEWIGRMVAPEATEMVGYGKYPTRRTRRCWRATPPMRSGC